MKKRKILYLFPLAALILSGCDFDPQSFLSQAKGFVKDKIVNPVKELINPGSTDKKEEGGEKQGEDGKKEEGQKEDTPAVSKVTISGADETNVLDGTRVSLKATVSGEEGVSQKVTWATSDNTVATVTNGVVNFLKVSEEKEVKISAASVDDPSKKAEVAFTVTHSPFDLKNSRGNPDTSCYIDEGKFIVEDPQDVALIYSDIYDTRWYAEATITITELDKTDQWPKFGIMASERDDGFWVHEQSKQLFFYADTPSAQTTWNNLNVVPENADATDWAWAGQLGGGAATPAMKLGEPFKMGFMRDGSKFYTFYGKATDITLGLVSAVEYDHFGENPNYVWVGGWKSAVEVADPKCLVGDEIDALYEVPEGMSIKATEETVYLGNTYQIEVNTEGLWDRNKLEFTSDNEEIATVDEKGLVTANSTTAGTAHITVGLKGTEVSTTFTLNVTDDLLYNVVLDGEMNDLIWSETVKTNAYLLKKNDNYYVKIYGAKNSRGLYLFMDYVVAEKANCNPNEWWTWENVEFRLADDNKTWSGQYWVSSMNGGSFVSVGSGEKAEAVYYKALEQGTDNLYHGAFEMFVPFGDDCVTKDQATYACFGWAPKTGWYNGYNWYAGINENTLNITANGFAHDGTSCSEGHSYGAWVVDVAATCSYEGSRHRDCTFCGHRETEVLPIDPDAHVFDYEHATQTVVPDCMHTGIGTAVCTLCGAEENTVLPKDYTNHTDADYPSTHSYCHDCGIGSHLTNPAGDAYNHNFGGWDNKSTWTDFGIWGGDLKLEVEFHMDGCLGGNPDDAGSCCWRTVLPVLYDNGYDAGTHKVDKVFRMDWFGWADGDFVTEQNNGSIPEGFDWGKNYEAFSNMDVALTFTKTGSLVKLDWVWTCLATEGMYVGKTYEYHQSCNLVDGTDVGFALSAEWTNYTVTKADLSR